MAGNLLNQVAFVVLAIIMLECSPAYPGEELKQADPADDAVNPELPELQLPERFRATGPPGKHHVIASRIICDDAGERHQLSLQVVDLWLILLKYDGFYPRQPSYVKRFAYLLIESPLDNPAESRFLGLQYSARPSVNFSSLDGDIVCDPSSKRVYVMASCVDSGLGEREVWIWAAERGRPGDMPQFDPAHADKWLPPTMTPVGALSLSAEGGSVLLTVCYDNDRLLLHGATGKYGDVQGRRIILALDLKTLKWSRLDVQGKELEDQSHVRF